MAFNKDYRTRVVRQIKERYRCYWHSMHPRTFTSRELYKVGFAKEEWEALLLLRSNRKEVIQSGGQWTYNLDLSAMLDLPDYVPGKPTLTFDNKKGWPTLDIQEQEFPVEIQEKMRDWVLTAYQYENDSNILGEKLAELIKLDWDYERDRDVAIVNTPGCLYRIWPELLPFLDSGDRHVLRNKKVKSPLPKAWEEGEADLAKFHYGPAMERITYALTVMSLIPNEYDKKYPNLS